MSCKIKILTWQANVGSLGKVSELRVWLPYMILYCYTRHFWGKWIRKQIYFLIIIFLIKKSTKFCKKNSWSDPELGSDLYQNRADPQHCFAWSLWLSMREGKWETIFFFKWHTTFSWPKLDTFIYREREKKIWARHMKLKFYPIIIKQIRHRRSDYI